MNRYNLHLKHPFKKKIPYLYDGAHWVKNGLEPGDGMWPNHIRLNKAYSSQTSWTIDSFQRIDTIDILRYYEPMEAGLDWIMNRP